MDEYSVPCRLLHQFVLLVTLCCVATELRGDEESRRGPDSIALTEFLRRFDPIAAQGFVKTRRTGDTGVGYTLESLLGIEENNSPRGDLLGMEIKARRTGTSDSDHRHPMNLFLKEPNWVDGLDAVGRIQRYGYVDDNDRRAWYQSVTVNPNDGGLRLLVDVGTGSLHLQRHGRSIAFWTRAVLRQRLTEKLNEVVFVDATTRHSGVREEFRYGRVTYYARPSVDEFVKLIETGEVIVELRMHVDRSGRTRNHGTAFRIRRERLKALFAQSFQYTPLPAAYPDQERDSDRRSATAPN